MIIADIRKSNKKLNKEEVQEVATKYWL
jgi:hypothetical protein